MKTRLAALLILLSFVLPPLAAAATAGPVFGLRAVGNPKRGYFVYNLAPGATRPGAVIVSNTGNRTGIVKLYSADGTTGQTTGTVYLTDSKPVHAGAWVKLAQPSVQLAPGEIKHVAFTVHVPTGSKPGQWVGHRRRDRDVGEDEALDAQGRRPDPHQEPDDHRGAGQRAGPSAPRSRSAAPRRAASVASSRCLSISPTTGTCSRSRGAQ